MRVLWKHWPSLVAAVLVCVVSGVLCGSLGFQFIEGELPCPLCVIQRLCFLLACVGPLGVLLDRGGAGVSTRQAKGFGLCIFASILGACAAARQVLLHIVPPDAGYGPPILGLHLYSWALVVFVCLIFGSAVGLLGLGEDKAPLPALVRRTIAVILVALAVILAGATFVMEGFRFLLPDDPSRYELLHQFQPGTAGGQPPQS